MTQTYPLYWIAEGIFTAVMAFCFLPIMLWLFVICKMRRLFTDT